MKRLFLVLGFFSLLHVHGQKLVKKALINEGITSVQIDSQYCYRVNLSTAKTNEIHVAASMEGEYSNELLISIEEKGTTVFISSGFQPNYSNPNDKLSAHKVISIKMDVIVPEQRSVALYGTSSNVLVEGIYKNLKVQLNDGRCTLQNVKGKVEVLTQKGDILASTTSGNIIAESQYGTIASEEIPQGPTEYILNTITGNIHLKKTK